MNKQISWRIWGMTIALSLLFFSGILDGWAQTPLLKTVEIPDAVSHSLRADGFLGSHWTQDYPYNQLCPRDPVNGNAYSCAGCPAIAMGQIINYLRTTEGTRFSDNDDYAHHYAGRNFIIDDDWASLKFPSFPQLNDLLDSVDAAFESGENLPTCWLLPWFLLAARPSRRYIPRKVPAPFLWIRRLKPTNDLVLGTVCCFVNPIQ